MPHLKVNEDLNSKFGMATIINGPHKDEYGCVAIEFGDGECIIDLGIPNKYSKEESVCVYAHKKDLQFWIKAKSIDLTVNPPIIIEDK